MHDPATRWLVITNVALGVAVILLLLTVVGSAIRAIISERRRRRELRALDREIWHLFHDSRS